MEERNYWHESQIDITLNEKFIESLYDFNVAFTKLTELKQQDEINSEEKKIELNQLNQICLDLLKSFLSISIQESDKKTSFRNWLIWKKGFIEECFSSLHIDEKNRNEYTELFDAFNQKIDILQNVPEDTQFDATYQEYKRALSLLKEGRTKSSIIENSVNRFFSLINTIINKEYFRFYDKNKKDFQEDFDLIKKVIRSLGKDSGEIEKEWKNRKLIMSTEVDLCKIQNKAIYDAFENLIVERKKGLLEKLIDALNKKIDEIKSQLKSILEDTISFGKIVKHIFTEPGDTLKRINIALDHPKEAFNTIWTWIKDNPFKTAIFSIAGLVLVAGIVAGSVYLVPVAATGIAAGVAATSAEAAATVATSFAMATVTIGSIILTPTVLVGGVVLASGAGKEIIETKKAQDEIDRYEEEIEKIKKSIKSECNEEIRNIREKELEEVTVKMTRAKSKVEAAQRRAIVESNLNSNLTDEKKAAESKLHRELVDATNVLSSTFEKKENLYKKQEKINESMSRNKNNESELHKIRDSMKNDNIHKRSKKTEKFAFFKSEEDNDVNDSDCTTSSLPKKYE